jgi:hypothetical protein
MRKMLTLSILVIGLFAFSGCGSSSSDGYTPPPVTQPPVVEPPAVEPPVVEPPLTGGPDPIPPLMESVDILDLYLGYAVEGYSAYGEFVALEYCMDSYDFYRDTEHFFGSFSSSDFTINMYDSDGGSYVIDSDDGFLHIGGNYYIFDVDTDITVDNIYPIDCY